MNFIRDERGTAFSIFIIILVFILASIAMIISIPSFNSAISQYNTLFVEKNISSERTAETLSFQFSMLKAIPFFVAFVLLFVFPIVRALLKRRAEGG